MLKIELANIKMEEGDIRTLPPSLSPFVLSVLPFVINKVCIYVHILSYSECI